jgi:hypothetical protein
MPNHLCPDGKTVAGPGACVDKGGFCGWEIVSCPVSPPPPKDCSAPMACGPSLGLANYLCPDGKTWGGPGACVDKGGFCGWEMVSCPTPPPPPKLDCSAPSACGPSLGMPNYLCPDGKTVGGPGACVDKGGVCGWEIVTCPK